ncbi:hypothetical protein C2I36_10505 [Rhodobacteraceae bacterium WD3A24]|nr:hypothetical protein C2I36_10505 [Rhodobacteraceae bacterium WD3A24]
MRSLIGYSLVAAFAGTAAIASGPGPAPVEPQVVEPAQPAFTWTGGYAGLQAGTLQGEIDLDTVRTSPPPAFPGAQEHTASPDASGGEIGIYGGYNWQGANNTVFGIEGEFNWSNADGSDDGSWSGGGGDEVRAGQNSIGQEHGGGRGPLGGGIESEIHSTAALRGRIGYAMDRTLIYAAGGVAFADLEMTGYNNGGREQFNERDNRTGWTIGAGVEHAISDSMIARLDYRFSDFGTETFDFTSVGGSGHVHDVDVELQTHQLRAGIAFRF